MWGKHGQPISPSSRTKEDKYYVLSVEPSAGTLGCSHNFTLKC